MNSTVDSSGFIREPERNLRVLHEADICVVGGSCTGLFAAVRAARLGARVVLVEKLNQLGGTATAGLVNVWHSLFEDGGSRQVIAGLTAEVEQRLERRGALRYENTACVGCRFLPARLACELDRLAIENKVTLMLHSFYDGIILDDDGCISAIVVATKEGRVAVKASFFIDASGDGDVARDLGLDSYRFEVPQPASSCFLLQGATPRGEAWARLFAEHGAEFGLKPDWGWGGPIPGLDGISFRADNHVPEVDPLCVESLSSAEVEGRRRSAALVDMVRKYGGYPQTELVAVCSALGIRDGTHYRTAFEATERGLLTGEKYSDPILHGTYRIDIHHAHDDGITFKYLSGKTHTQYGRSSARDVIGSWREEMGFTGESATYYSLPFEAIVQNKCPNFIAVGRMLNAQPGAFGALRVMVNLNQLGEAAGVAASLALDASIPIWKLDGGKVTGALIAGGSALIR